MNSYDQQREVETETESLKRYDDTVLYYENRIENCDNAINALSIARAHVALAIDETYGILELVKMIESLKEQLAEIEGHMRTYREMKNYFVEAYKYLTERSDDL
jgi:hypothetical protein